MNRQALSGLRVLEYSEFVSGPYCGKLLADLGAEVIKVEKPGLGDKARSWGPFPQDIPHPEKSGLFLSLNTNKLGVTLNLKSAMGVKIFKELVKQVDILVENNPPQEMERLALDYESLRQVNPGLVMTSITPFGQSGPYRDHKGCDLISSHTSGEAYTNPVAGVDDLEQQPPLKVPMHAGDCMSGLTAAVGTMSAIITRQITGLGQHVDLSEQEALASIARRDIGVFTHEGTRYDRARSSKQRHGTTVFPCKNGHIVMSLNNDAFWAGLVETMGNPDWAKSEIFQDRFSRTANWKKIEPKIIEWTRQHTTEEVIKAAQGNRFPIMPVQTVKQMVNEEQLTTREFFVEVDHPETGKLKYLGAPYKLSATPWRVKRPAPLLGEHNEQVYCQMLGYTRQDLVKMRQAGII